MDPNYSLDLQDPEKNIPSIPKKKHSLFEKIILFILIVILCQLLIVSPFILSPFQISGRSMEKNYFDREYILVDKISYLKIWSWEFSRPVRGDVVIIKPHTVNNKEYYIKRVIGLPWETISFRYGKVYIKTDATSPEIELQEWYLDPADQSKTFPPLDVSENSFQIPEWEYFLIWDNRSNSIDSRHCFISCSLPNTSHFLKRENITGKVFTSFWYTPLFQDTEAIESVKKIPMRWFDTIRSWHYPEFDKNALQNVQ